MYDTYTPMKDRKTDKTKINSAADSKYGALYTKGGF